MQDFFNGTCDLVTDDISDLGEIMSRASDPADFVIRPERLSKEPLGPLVRWDDGAWLVLVRAVYATLIDAEERGLSRQDARSMLDGSHRAAARTYLALTAQAGRALSLSPVWAAAVVAAVGNYGEMYERNLGQDSRLKLPRGLNRLWTDGGLMYAPPFQ